MNWAKDHLIRIMFKIDFFPKSMKLGFNTSVYILHLWWGSRKYVLYKSEAIF